MPSNRHSVPLDRTFVSGLGECAPRSTTGWATTWLWAPVTTTERRAERGPLDAAFGQGRDPCSERVLQPGAASGVVDPEGLLSDRVEHRLGSSASALRARRERHQLTVASRLLGAGEGRVYEADAAERSLSQARGVVDADVSHLQPDRTERQRNEGTERSARGQS